MTRQVLKFDLNSLLSLILVVFIFSVFVAVLKEGKKKENQTNPRVEDTR